MGAYVGRGGRRRGAVDANQNRRRDRFNHFTPIGCCGVVHYVPRCAGGIDTQRMIGIPTVVIIHAAS